MQHDERTDFTQTITVGRVNNSEDASTNGEEVNSRLFQSNNTKRLFTKDPSASVQPLKESFLSCSSTCHADSSMAQPTSSNSYYNSQTGTSIVHISSSSSSVSRTVRENSNYIDRQWALLTEKMYSKGKQSSQVNSKEVALPEFVEERCEVDFSFIDEPNGNELDNNYAKYADEYKSKITTGHVSNILHKNNSNNNNEGSFDSTFNDNHSVDGSIPPQSTSVQTYNGQCKLPNKSDGNVVSSSHLVLEKVSKSEDVSKHSFEKSKNDRNSVQHSALRDIDKGLLTLKSSMLVPSYKDEFLNSLNSIPMTTLKEPIKESRELPSTYRELRSLNLQEALNKPSLVSSWSEDKSNNVTNSVTDGFFNHEIQAKDIEQDDHKCPKENKSKKYQEMFCRKNLKKELKGRNIISSDQVPDYKGDNPSLEEIMSFINKDVKVFSNAPPPKSNKKLKKKISKKDSLDGSIDGADLPRIVTSPVQTTHKAEQSIGSSTKIHESLSENKFEKSVNNCDFENFEITKNHKKEDPMFHSKVLEEEVGPVSISKNSFSDCEQFSVVKKKKKLKKLNDSHKQLEKSNVSCPVSKVLNTLASSIDACSKSEKNKANMNMRGTILVGEQNIPRIQNCQHFLNHVKENDILNPLKDLNNFEKDKSSQNVIDLSEKIESTPKELWNSRQGCKKNEDVATATTITIQDSSPNCNGALSLLIPDKIELSIKCIPKPLLRTNIKTGIIEEACPVRKLDSLLNLSKSRSAFNLRRAQAFMNSTYQEVIKGKGYVLYGHCNG